MGETNCTCEAGYSKNHALDCALVRGNDVDREPDQVLDYPRAAIREAIDLEIE